VRRARRSFVLAACAASLLAGGAPASASAAQVTLDGDRLVIAAGPATDALYLTKAGDQLLMTGLRRDAGTAPAPCAWTDYSLTCPLPGRLEIDLGDGDDELRADAIDTPMTIDDGPGNDRVDGGSGDTLFLNGAGDDVLRGHGRDRYLSGPGADTFGGDGPLDGDDFLDTVSYAAETRPVYVDATWTWNGSGYDDDGVSGEHDTVAGGIERIEGGGAGDVIGAGASVREVAGGAGDDTLIGPPRRADTWYVAALVLDGGPGADRLSARGMPAQLLGGDGADVLQGGEQSDRVYGGPGDDTLSGGAADDLLEGGPGRDAIAGGDGADSADYGARRGDLRLTLDGVANDGEAGEGDALAGDVERLVGGAGNDLLAGNAADNTLEGATGSSAGAGATSRSADRASTPRTSPTCARTPSSRCVTATRRRSTSTTCRTPSTGIA
jgi:Ca2+-binding RTX toxin-like protein